MHYLGYYLKWHPQSCYYYAVEHGGFQASPERTPGTYSKYNSIDDRIDDFHYYTTYIKFGIGRATYDAAQEIRSGDITRDEGVALVQALRRRIPGALRRRDLPLSEHSRKEFPEASKMFEQPIMDRSILHAARRHFPLAASVEAGRQTGSCDTRAARLRCGNHDERALMSHVRIIARLDIKGPNLIKGVHLEGLRVIGDPQEYARRYYEAGRGRTDLHGHRGEPLSAATTSPTSCAHGGPASSFRSRSAAAFARWTT